MRCARSIPRSSTSSDSAAYATLFAPDAIRIPPGSDPEHGPDAIRKGEQADVSPMVSG